MSKATGTTARPAASAARGPKGDKGDKGDPGEQGPAGPRGHKGEAGGDVSAFEARLAEIERRLGIDHAAIEADRQASLEAGKLAAPLAEAA